MSVGFKCRDTSRTVGYPTRAKACRCTNQVVDTNDGLCVLCGHQPVELIDRQWEDQLWRNRRSVPKRRGGVFA